MRVTLVNTVSDGGGAAIAAKRLIYALKLKGVDIHCIVRDGRNSDENITILANSKFKRLMGFIRFALEKFYFLFYEKSSLIRFAFSPAIIGQKISTNKIIKNSDIIHLHWINNSFISLRELRRILRAGKPVVWTMHDMWAFTGGCHYTGECMNYLNNCGKCPYLKRPGTKDLSNRIFRKKQETYRGVPLYIIGISKWIAGCAKQSNLFKSFPIFSIPNAIDTDKFKPFDQKEARNSLNLPKDKRILLFGAANIFDERKGLKYLLEALDILVSDYPDYCDNLHCVLFGKAKASVTMSLPFSQFSFISSDSVLVELYSAVDLFILPSLQDNFPNTILEAMACCTPVVAFNTGGLTEMIEHKVDGYLAETIEGRQLAQGIIYVLKNNTDNAMGLKARDKIIAEYSPEKIGETHVQIYNEIITRFNQSKLQAND